MPVSGPIVHQQLIHAYNEAQRELETARGHVAAAGAELGELTQDRSEAMVHLAQHYLPELTEAAVRKTWSEAQDAVWAVLQRKVDHCNRLVAQLDEQSSRRAGAEARLQSTSAALDAAVESQGEIADAVSRELSADKSFADLTDRAAQAEAALQRGEANLNEIEQDARRKLPAYENSSLFMYLHKLGFLTPEYEHKGMSRSMDQWLGRYIGYRDAKQGYEFLVSTPKHMQEIIAQDRAALNTVLDELEKRRDVVAARLGLPDAIQKSENLTSQREGIIAELEAIKTTTDRIQTERTEIENTRGPYYREAIDKFREMIAAADPQSLARRARSTPEPEDDQIVARLQGAADEMQRMGAEVRQRQQLITHLTGHLQAVGEIISRFRAAGFDSQRAQFGGSEDIVEELSLARDGRDDYDQIWQRLRRSHRWGPSAVDQFTRVATHPMTQVLINAMAHAAAGALQAQARQAGQRRSTSRPSWNGGGQSGRRSGGGWSNRDSF